MCPTLSVSRWIVLLTLAVAMYTAISQVETAHVRQACYTTYSNEGQDTSVAPRWKKNIISCYEQNDYRCIPGYEVKTSGNRTMFLRPNTKWLKQMIEEGTLTCPPAFQ